MRYLFLVFSLSILVFGACKSKPDITSNTSKKEQEQKKAQNKSSKDGSINLIGFKANKAVTASGKVVAIPGLTDEKQSTYILVRHAEKITSQPNPGLTEAGLARAAKLAALLDGIKIDQIMSTDYNRTQATAAPLAKAKKLEVQSYDPSMQKDLFTDLAVFNKKNVVVVGHSNTIPKLANVLIGKDVFADYSEDNYSQLLIISVTQPGVATYERFEF